MLSVTQPADGLPEQPVRAAQTGLHGHMIDALGTAICSQKYPAGQTLTIEELEKAFTVSRSVAREAVRVLESMGLVTSRRRVGVVVLPPAHWNVFDPQVIRWRLATDHRPQQLRSLTELRLAVEPQAARWAAVRATLQQASDLVTLSARMWATGRAGDLDEFLELDMAYHALILRASGNEMFAHLTAMVSEVLTGRTAYGLMPTHPHVEALEMHSAVATAIQQGDADAAEASMRAIVTRAIDEMGAEWDPESASLAEPTTVGDR